MNKVSLIVTVLNEEKTIDVLLESIFNQVQLPDEIIIVDGGSRDNTVAKIKEFSRKFIKKHRTRKFPRNLEIKLQVKKGNRSVGRNYAISFVKNDYVAITDAGCILDKNWLKELITKRNKTNAPVVAGFYSGQAKTNFQKAIVPYALVMSNKVNEKTFLPATRSMLIEKKLFERLGGFNEKYSDNEDYVLAKVLEKNKIKIAFARKAVVSWIPPKNLIAFYKMIFRFARGDTFAGIIRPKVVLIFARYLLFLFGLFVSTYLGFLSSFITLSTFLLLVYITWAIQKNRQYVEGGWKYLPALQVGSDIAVLHGSTIGFFKRLFS